MDKLLKTLLTSRRRDQHGAVIPLVAVLLVVLVGFGALAFDVSHLRMVQNELQNAADAGALAGARFLYNDAGTVVNEDDKVFILAHGAATSNNALSTEGSVAVEVDDSTSNLETDDIQYGHWSFGRGSVECTDGEEKCFTPAPGDFNPNNPFANVDLANSDPGELDDNPYFINAVKVTVQRQETRASSFFARIFGYEDFGLAAHAVAYIGFAGSLNPLEVDQPIAICKEAIINDDGTYTCNTGRMFNSGGGTTNNTAAWTNFTQPCNTSTPPDIVGNNCNNGNQNVLKFGQGMGTVGGVQNSVYSYLRNCWINSPLQKDWRGLPKEVWSQTLPVILCPSNNPSPCSTLVGAVTVNFVWIKQSGTDPQWTDIPMQMEDWECSAWVNAGRPTNINNGLTEAQRQQCWQDFSTRFSLQTWNDTSVGTLDPSDIQRTMYFQPSCEFQEPTGVTGGENFGILAKIPVLVQ